MTRFYACLFFALPLLAASQTPAPCPLGTPPADFCFDACIFCGLNGYSGTTSGYSSAQLSGFCGTIENNQWLAIVPTASGGVITGTPFNCAHGDGIQLALYTSCSADAPLFCSGGSYGNGTTPMVLTVDGLVAGQIYYLMVDGYAGDQCDFNLDVAPANFLGPQPLPDAPSIPTGTNLACPGATLSYAIPPVTNASGYIWSLPPGASINGQSGTVTLAAPEGHSVDVTFGIAGGNVCVSPVNACNQPSDSIQSACKAVTVISLPPTLLPPAVICAEEAPYTLPWGQTVDGSGLYQIALDSYLGCDSIVRQQVTIKAPIVTNLGIIGACTPPACATICDTVICGQGVFSVVCTSATGCDSTVIFNLAVAGGVGINAPLGQTITCNVSDVLLNAQGNNLVNMAWTDNLGQVLSNNASLTASAPGYYTFAAAQALGAANCPYTKTLLVKKNIQAPEGTATGGVLNALNTSVQLTANAVTYPVLYSWSGPNGFNSTAQNPIVDVPGTYTVTLTNPATGCATSIEVQVIQQ